MIPVRFVFLPLAAAALGGNATIPPPVDVTVTVSGLRSDKGQVLACLTDDAGEFPDCRHDSRHTLAVPAGQALHLRFPDVAPGRYAIALLHDENGNGKIDKALIIPREGFGFSRDAPVRMGPPSFEAAAFDVGVESASQAIRMRYII